MTRGKVLTVLAASAMALPMLAAPALAQVDVYVHPAPTYTYDPPRSGAWGDRDRDGIPNIADNHNNNRDRRWDADRDGIPNRYDRDRDGDGVPNRWDSRPNNPWRN